MVAVNGRQVQNTCRLFGCNTKGAELPVRRIHASDDEPTDVARYFADHPDFVACRRKHDWLPDDECHIVDAPRDLAATHHRLKPCRRCGAVFRERFRILIRNGRVTRFDQLDSRTDYPQGYLAHGVRISRRDVTKHVTVREVEAQLSRSRKRPPSSKRTSRKAA